jgi:hypothetical protein
VEELIRIVVTAMVDLPSDVSVKRTGNDHFSIYEIKVAQTDTGKVLGKQGRNIEAIRTIINAASKKCHQRSLVEILE